MMQMFSKQVWQICARRVEPYAYRTGCEEFDCRQLGDSLFQRCVERKILGPFVVSPIAKPLSHYEGRVVESVATGASASAGGGDFRRLFLLLGGGLLSKSSSGAR